MNFLNIILLVAIVSILILGFAIIIKQGKKDVSKYYFFSICLGLIIWIATNFLVSYVINTKEAYILSAVSYGSAILIAYSFFFFSLFFIKVPFFWKKIYSFILIFLVLLICIGIYVPNFVIKEVTLHPWFITTGPGIYFVMAAVFLLFMSSFFILLYKYYCLKFTKLQLLQTKFIIFGTLISSVLGTISNAILPVLFGNYEFVRVGPVFTIVLVISITLAITRHHLFNIKVIAAEIFIFILWAVIFIRVLLIRDFQDFLISGTILVFAIIIGVFLIRSVTKEVRQREEIEKLAQKLQKTNERLKELDKLKTEFLSLATHQIRSPLTSMRGYISMIFEGDYGDVNENLKEPLRVVEKSSEGLVKVVNDFLDVSRIEQGRMKYNLEIYDFHQIVKNIIEEYRPAIEEKGLKIEFEAKEDDYSVKVDENKMEQVIGNLIDNAIKYTIEGEIKVRLFKNDSKTLQLEVSDSGVGIPPEEIKKLFTKFQRAKGAEKTNVTGTGLGIYLAKRITEDHGGTIKVSSEGEGKGSVFTVTLPVV